MTIDPSTPASTCVIVTASGDEDVHLALVEHGAGAPTTSLCGREVLPVPPTRRFQEAGCVACAGVSLARGIDCAQETAQIVVNLRRFHAWASRRQGPATAAAVAT